MEEKDRGCVRSKLFVILAAETHLKVTVQMEKVRLKCNMINCKMAPLCKRVSRSMGRLSAGECVCACVLLWDYRSTPSLNRVVLLQMFTLCCNSLP